MTLPLPYRVGFNHFLQTVIRERDEYQKGKWCWAGHAFVALPDDGAFKDPQVSKPIKLRLNGRKS